MGIMWKIAGPEQLQPWGTGPGRNDRLKTTPWGIGKAKAAPSVRSDSSAASDKARTLKPRSVKRRAMGRIEHTLLDEGR